jgi:iron complex transport system substrate-binding protein
MRIVSLLPSATEVVCRLGLLDSLVGVSHECDWPAAVRQLPKVTRSHIPAASASREIDALVRERLAERKSLYSLDAAMLAKLLPDLIVTQTLCDVCAVAEADVRAAACGFPGQARIVNLEPTTLGGAVDCLRQVGEAANCEERAEREIAALRGRIDAVAERSAKIRASDRPRVVVLEWIDPPFSSGQWGPEFVDLAGGRELIGIAGERSRTIDWKDVVSARPDVVFIACCGYDAERTLADLPILKRQPGWSDLPAVKSGRVYVADGSAYFNRPGPQLVDSLEILAHALHPAIHVLPDWLRPAVPAC